MIIIEDVGIVGAIEDGASAGPRIKPAHKGQMIEGLAFRALNSWSFSPLLGRKKHEFQHEFWNRACKSALHPANILSGNMETGCEGQG
jgi:hypothetical protein